MKLGERGRGRDGKPRIVDVRLYLQLHAFGECIDTAPIIDAVQAASNAGTFEGVVYQDLNDPRGIALLAAHEDPAYFATGLRDLLLQEPFLDLMPKPELTMIGRTYSIGYEIDLEDVLLHRSRRRFYSPDYPWAIWYPLRRGGSFEQLSEDEQKEILMEHAGLGISFSQAGYGQDVRLACHGLDAADNDFVIGLLGPELYPLSAMVQTMRKTKQTSQHLDRLGPFIVGHTLWQSPVPA